jgi:hypothetical protein
MKRMGTQIIPALIMAVSAAVFLLSSCASVRFVQKEADVMALVSLINQGEAETLSRLTQSPFLFDREILMLAKDTKTVWKNLAEAGFALDQPKVLRIEPVSEESYRDFADVMEIEVYFRKYVPKTAKIARIESRGGSCLFILNDKQAGYPLILGLKVW